MLAYVLKRIELRFAAMGRRTGVDIEAVDVRLKRSDEVLELQATLESQ